MDKFFNSDNVVMRTLSKIFDIGWLTLISCFVFRLLPWEQQRHRCIM